MLRPINRMRTRPDNRCQAWGEYVRTRQIQLHHQLIKGRGLFLQEFLRQRRPIGDPSKYNCIIKIIAGVMHHAAIFTLAVT